MNQERYLFVYVLASMRLGMAMRRLAVALFVTMLCVLCNDNLHAGETVVIKPRVAAAAIQPLVRSRVELHMAWDKPLAALAVALETLAREPESADAWGMAAAAFFRNADFDAAESAAQHALKLDPSQPDAHVALARCFDTRGFDEKERAHLEAAVQADAGHPTALRQLAGALDHNKERARAIELCKRYATSKDLGPRGELFTRYALQLLKLFDALKETELSLLPPETERAERATTALSMAGDAPSIELDLNGVRKRFLFDTGEESLTLTLETAKACGAKHVGELSSATATGIATMKVVLVPEIKLGEFRVRNVLAGVGTSDIVGPPIFKNCRVKMDFGKGEAVLTNQLSDAKPTPQDLELQAGDTPGVRRVRFRRHGGMVWVAVKTPKEAAPLTRRSAWGFLDTGCAPQALLFPRYLEALKSEPGKGPLALPFKTSLEGAVGEGDTQFMRVLPEFTLNFLGVEVNVDEALSTDALLSVSATCECELDVIVGWPPLRRAFKSIEIDYMRCVLVLVPRSNQ